jgi:DNA-binding SARP family transcriptional activator/NTP pyrophosphatase (non-canonical NTP hydrolase)
VPPPPEPAPVAEAPDPPQPSAGHPRFSGVTADADGEPSAEAPLPAPVGIAGAALLAAGLVATVTRLRRAQVRRRRPGQLIPIPEGEPAEAEAVVRAVASLDRADRLDIVMRALAERLAPTDVPVPAIQAVLAGTDIEILFADPVPAEPGPFRVEAGGRAWTLTGTVDASRLGTGAGTSSPVPCLVPVGRIEDRDLLIDLEAPPVTELVGDSEEVDALLWSLAAALATSQWTDDVRVVALGEVAPGFERLERMEVTTDREAIERLLDDAAAMREELADCGAVSTMQARLAGGSWTPTVLLVPASTGSDEAQRVCEKAMEVGGFTVVTAAEVDVAGRRLSVQHGAVSVTPPGIVAAVPEWPEELRRAIGEVMDLAVPDETRQGAPVIDVPQVAGGEVEEVLAADVGDLQGPLPPGALLLRTLGAVEIERGPDVDRRKSKELVAYLALHPEGVDEQRLKTVLWPEGVPSGHAFNQLVSRTRMRLGTAPDGSRYLPRLQGGRYRLSEWVTTDAHGLGAAFRSARARPAPDTMERLADALRLVRGQPFQGVKAGYEWGHSEGFASRFEILVGEAAHLLAEWHLDHGEATAALWAADQGLLASPVDEALYRDRMRAYHLAGNAAAVDAVMRELCEVADAMEPYDSLHPATIELYQRLTRRRVG